ncbi:MAG: DegT/DnrJ/EryC1/StrS family aminotransferase [Nitrospinales bacterium]
MKNTFISEYETKKELADFILKTARLSMDKECLKFERKFAEYQQRTEAVLFNSGGSANLALIQALLNLGLLERGQRVGVSALTWSTNVMPVIQLGLVPVVIDCAVDTLNVMNNNLVSRLEQDDIEMLFVTNALGFAGDLDRMHATCRKKNIILLEDNCESLGTELEPGKAGNFGLAATFSFFVAHHMSTIEGGMVCTDDGDLAEMLRIVRANGWDRNLTSERQIKWRKEFQIENEFEAKYTFYDLGFNLRPTEITGFLGLSQLRNLEKNIQAREKNYLQLESAVKDNPELIKIRWDHLKRISSFAFPVICRTPELRKKYLYQFAGAGIEVRPMIAGNLQKQPFFKKYVSREFDLPGAEFLHHCGFYCGNYFELSESDLEIIQGCLRLY